MQKQIQAAEQTISKDAYFQEMRETWDCTREYMLKKLSELEAINKRAALAIQENAVVKKRLSLEKQNVNLRPFLMRLSFEACRGYDWKRIIPACAAAEFLNISTYIINAIFDEKGESRKDINQYIIAGMVFRDLASECLLEANVSLSPEENREISQRLIEINKLSYIGQHIDLYQLKKENIADFNSFEEMKILYLDRTEKICGKFMENIACIGAILADATAEQLETLKNFGLSYGNGVQIANDLGDFVLGTSQAVDFEKTYKDQYSDIRHGKLTYPIILGLEIAEETPVKALLGKDNVNYKELELLTRYLKESGIFEKIKELSKAEYYECKRTLRNLPKSEARSMLSLMASMLRSNKYFTFFRKLEETKPLNSNSL